MAKKKSFTASPAMNFISPESIEKVDGKQTAKKKTPSKATTPKSNKAPEGYKVNPEYIETKSKRVQLLVQPSVYEEVKAKAKAEGISTNEAINEALREYTER